MDRPFLYREGPCLAQEMPEEPLGQYLKRYGTGPTGLCIIVAVASHETVFGDPWAKVADVSALLGINVHPSMNLLIRKGWVEKRLVEASKRAPRAGHGGTIYLIRLTVLGWEYVTKYLGVTRDVTDNATGNRDSG